jgi:hypothetical protein
MGYKLGKAVSQLGFTHAISYEVRKQFSNRTRCQLDENIHPESVVWEVKQFLPLL